YFIPFFLQPTCSQALMAARLSFLRCPPPRSPLSMVMRLGVVLSPGCQPPRCLGCGRDAERRSRHSHAERGNEKDRAGGTRGKRGPPGTAARPAVLPWREFPPDSVFRATAAVPHTYGSVLRKNEKLFLPSARAHGPIFLRPRRWLAWSHP